MSGTDKNIIPTLYFPENSFLMPYYMPHGYTDPLRSLQGQFNSKCNVCIPIGNRCKYELKEGIMKRLSAKIWEDKGQWNNIRAVHIFSTRLGSGH